MESKPKLAVISTWRIACGIAGFAHKMVPAFEKRFEVDVYPLEQSILKSNEKQLIKMGNKLIEEMAEKIKDYDLVNIQLEPGIFGNRPKDIFSRLDTLIKASKKVFITFHTVRQGTEFTYPGFARRFVSRNPIKAIDYLNDSKFDRSYIKLYKKLNSGKFPNLFCVYHTKSAAKYVNIRYPNIKTINFPLTFIDQEAKEDFEVSVAQDRKWLTDRYGIDEDDVIVSSYGFISKYKGFETAIKAVYECADNVKLVIFGAIHPNSIQKFKPHDTYLHDLIGMVNRRNKGIPDIVEELLNSDGQVSMDFRGLDKIYKKGKNSQIKNKVIFAGSLTDPEFERAINGSDINVLSYQEVGQTSSGPIAISLDLKKKTIATYTKCFNQLTRYAKNCFDQFDIGNHLQLKKLIELYVNDKQNNSGQQDYESTYNIENRVELIYENYLNL